MNFIQKVLLISLVICCQMIAFSENPPEETVTVSESVSFNSSDIPIVVIDTQGADIVDEPKTTAYMGIIYNGPGNRNYLSDPYNEYDGWIGIEHRGNASLHISNKKPFTFETRNEDGSNNNVEILGLPEENDFILRAGYIDKTLMRDALAYAMSRGMGIWAPRTRHVELVLNGSYEGVYTLVEKIKPDDNRLNITRMDSTDISGEALTGGYVWAVQQSDGDDVVFLNSFWEGNERVLKYPKPDEVTPEQVEYIHDYEESFRNVMKRSYYDDPERGYPAYIDPATFVDEIIIQELTSNSDAYGWSSYFYKDRGGKMCAGPAWDFDQALSNSTYNDGDRYDEFIISKEDWSRPSYWDRLWETQAFKNQVKEKWYTYRQGPLTDDRIFSLIDSMANYLEEAQGRNFTRWPILGVPVWRSPSGAEERDTYQKEVDYMKTWLDLHLQWLDIYLKPSSSSVDHPAQNKETFVLYQNYPNPFNPETTIRYRISEASPVQLTVHNVLGREVIVLVDEVQSPGIYDIQFNPEKNKKDFNASSVYYYILESSGKRVTKKMLYLK